MVNGIGVSGQEAGEERGCRAVFCNWLGLIVAICRVFEVVLFGITVKKV